MDFGGSKMDRLTVLQIRSRACFSQDNERYRAPAARPDGAAQYKRRFNCRCWAKMKGSTGTLALSEHASRGSNGKISLFSGTDINHLRRQTFD